MAKSTTVNKNEFIPFANGGCKNLLQSTRTVSQSHPLLMVDIKVNNTVNENTFLLLLNQYEFISSMHAVLKMFWLFDCCKCTIECIFSWNFIMNRLFQQIPIRTNIIKHYIFKWLVLIVIYMDFYLSAAYIFGIYQLYIYIWTPNYQLYIYIWTLTYQLYIYIWTLTYQLYINLDSYLSAL